MRRKRQGDELPATRERVIIDKRPGIEVRKDQAHLDEVLKEKRKGRKRDD